MLIDNKALELVRPFLRSDDFFREAHRLIVRGIDAVIRGGGNADVLTVTEHLKTTGELDDAGGPAYIAALVDGVPRSSNAVHYGEIIKAKAGQRHLIRTANAMMAKAYEETDAPDTIRKEFVQSLSTMAAAGANVRKRDFQALGEGRYSLRIDPYGIVFDVDRLRRERGELKGELEVKVNGSFPMAKTVDGVLSMADFNMSAARSRSERASLLSDRSQQSELDWYGFLEEFCLKVLSAERAGAPATVLADVDDEVERAETWEVLDLPILKDLPMILHGDGGSGKSYLAMLIAGTLAQLDVNVLYADWEFSEREHRKRFGRLFRPMMPRNVHYVRCDRGIRDEVDRLRRLVKSLGIGYFIGDSVAFACEGRPEEAEQAGNYFRALREIGVGSLNIAHVTKQSATDAGGNNDAGPFGSRFWFNGARSIWSMQKAEDNPHGELRVGLYHRKSNTGGLLKPRAYTLHFESEKTWFETTKVGDVDELAARMPIVDRLRKLLAKGAMKPKEAADALGVTVPVLRTTVARHSKSFIKVGDKYALVSNATEF